MGVFLVIALSLIVLAITGRLFLRHRGPAVSEMSRQDQVIAARNSQAGQGSHEVVKQQGFGPSHHFGQSGRR